MAAIANRHAPLEAGGVLLGYGTGDATVVTAQIGPGPRASHRRRRFTPDHKYQDRLISEHYERSGRRESYLGDWHSHPGGAARLSLRDRWTLALIARDPSARAPSPVMIVLVGRTWQVTAFQFTSARLGLARFQPIPIREWD